MSVWGEVSLGYIWREILSWKANRASIRSEERNPYTRRGVCWLYKFGVRFRYGASLRVTCDHDGRHLVGCCTLGAQAALSLLCVETCDFGPEHCFHSTNDEILGESVMRKGVVVWVSDFCKRLQSRCSRSRRPICSVIVQWEVL